MGNYYSLGHTIKQSTLSGWKSVSQGFRQFLESVVMCVFEGCVSKELHSCAVLPWNTSTETPSNCNPNPVNHILSLKMPSNLWGAAFGPHKWHTHTHTHGQRQTQLLSLVWGNTSFKFSLAISVWTPSTLTVYVQWWTHCWSGFPGRKWRLSQTESVWTQKAFYLRAACVFGVIASAGCQLLRTKTLLSINQCKSKFTEQTQSGTLSPK